LRGGRGESLTGIEEMEGEVDEGKKEESLNPII